MSKSFGEVYPISVFLEGGPVPNAYSISFFPKILLSDGLRVFDKDSVTGFKSKSYAFRSKYKDRIISTFLEDILNAYNVDNLSQNNTTTSLVNSVIADVLLQKFNDKWSKLSILYQQGYDALQPFNITLSESTKDKLKTLQDSANRVVNLTDKTDYETLKDKSDTTENNKTHGFNSLTGVPTDDSQSVVENEFKSTNTDTRNGSTTDTRNYERDIDTSRDYTRVGNIGNTSLSQLIVEEREKLRFIIIDEIYNDIASVLCRGKYI